MTTKRRAVALLLSPVTIPFLLFSEFMEWFHFNVSGKLLGSSRKAKRKLAAFFDAL